MSLPKEALAILRSCHELMREMERTSEHTDFSEQDLFKLSSLLRSFSTSENRDLEQLSLIPEHLHPQMSKRHFLNFVVPVERLLQRNLSEDSFLITSTDRLQAPATKAPLYFVLENIRSAFNVGSIFRLADCIGVSEIHLCGYTPTPSQEALKKTSLGASDVVNWRHFDRLEESLDFLCAQKIRVCALETTRASTSLFEWKPQGPSALVVGNERYGLESSALEKCDQVLSIPTFGVKNSLNVANALSIAAYEWRRQWK